MKLIIIILIIIRICASSAQDEQIPGSSEVCQGLKVAFKQQRYMSESLRKEYCHWGCKFANVDCSLVNPEESKISLEVFSNLYAKCKDYLVTKDTTFQVWSELRYEAEPVYDLINFLAPYWLTFVPILLNRMFFRSDESNGFLLLSLLVYSVVVTFMYYNNVTALIYNAIYVLAALFTPFTAEIFKDLVIGFAVNVITLIVALSNLGPWPQLFLGFVTASLNGIGFFNGIRSNSPTARFGILLSLTQLVVSLMTLQYIIRVLSVWSVNIAVFQYVVFSILPYGPGMHGFDNIAYNSARLAESLPITEHQRVLVFIGLYLAALITFFIIRASIGGVVLASLRFKFSAGDLLQGAYSYTVDLFGPIYVIFDVFGIGRDRLKYRKVLYAIVMAILAAFEIKFFFEFFILRLTVVVVDMAFINSSYPNMVRFLDMDVDCSALVFPKLGAMPTLSLDAVYRISQCVYPITSTVYAPGGQAVSEKQGVCLIRRHESGGAQVLSAKHCFEDNSKVLGVQLDGPKQVHGGAVDPVTSVRNSNLEKYAGFLQFIGPHEKKKLMYLVIIHKNRLMTYVSNFTFRKDGDIDAVFNTKQGDSGSPVIGILEDGLHRYVGVVSRGTFDEGSGNIISVVSDPTGKTFVGSPGTNNATYDVTPDNGTEEKITAKIREMFIINNIEFLKYTLLDNFDRYKDVPWDDIPEEIKKRAGERIKSWKKSRAFKKRNEAFTDLVGLLNDTYAKHDILLAFSEGFIREFNIKRQRQLPPADMYFVPAGRGGVVTGNYG